MPAASVPPRARALWRRATDVPLATGVLLAQVLVLAVALVPLGLVAVAQVQTSEQERAVAQTRSVTLTLTSAPWLAEAVTGPDPAAALAEPIERVRAATGVDFVVVMDTDGVRWTHPSPDRVGREFVGEIAPALAGDIVTEQIPGTIGEVVQVTAAVTSEGRVVALVSTGVEMTDVTARVRATLTGLGVVALAGLVVALTVAWVFTRSVRRRTFGLGPSGLARLHGYQDALLTSTTACLVMVDETGRIVLVNAPARRLLGLGESDVPAGSPACELAEHGVDPDLVDLLTGGRACHEEVFSTGGRSVVVTQSTARSDGRAVGWVATLADRTDLARASGELDNLRTFTESLRARSHEADNRLHTVAMLVELGEHERAIEFATQATRASQALTDAVHARASDPALAALVLGKTAQGAERGVDVRADALEVPDGALPSSAAVTIVGNLLDNALDAAATAPAPRWVSLRGRVRGGTLVLSVSDSGPGVPPSERERVFQRGYTTKQGGADRAHGRGIGLSLVAHEVARLHGTISIVEQEGRAVFEVRVPLGEAETSRSTPDADPRPLEHHGEEHA